MKSLRHCVSEFRIKNDTSEYASSTIVCTTKRSVTPALLHSLKNILPLSPKRTLKQLTTMAIGYGYSNRCDRYRHKPSLNLTLKQKLLWKNVNFGKL